MDHKIINVLTECLNVKPNQIVPEAYIIDDLGADSLDTVEIVMRLEEAFDIQIDDEDSEKMFKVQDIINYIEQQWGYDLDSFFNQYLFHHQLPVFEYFIKKTTSIEIK